jgi:hypothetical protein
MIQYKVLPKFYSKCHKTPEKLHEQKIFFCPAILASIVTF